MNSNGASSKVEKKRQYNYLRDRKCSDCGETIWNQSLYKPASCPSCKQSIRFRSQSFSDPSIRRCENCDVYLHIDDSFCCVCKFGNNVAIRKKRVRMEVEANKTKSESAAKIRKLEAELKEKNTRLAILEEEMRKAEELEMAKKHLGEIEDSMLEDDTAFTDAPNAEKDELEEVNLE